MGDDLLTVSGAGTRLTIQGRGDTAHVSSAQVIMVDGSDAAVAGNGNTFHLFGASILTVSGNVESFVYAAVPGTGVIAGYTATDQMTFDHSTFANWQSLLGHTNQSGADTVIHTDTSHGVTLQHVALTSLNQNNFHFA